MKILKTKSGIHVCSGEQLSNYRDAASWWVEPHPEFGSLVNPIPTGGKGADYAHHVTACPPRFENLTASLIIT